MTKTIEQWLQEHLTPEQFENAKKCKFEDQDWEQKFELLRVAICKGFRWSAMPEGFDYWSDFWCSLP